MSDYLFCGVVEIRSVRDRLGTACGRYARTLCYDCGTSLCPDHAERCELCRESLCSSCLSFHQSEHTKPADRGQLTELPEKKTA
jgi:hypothetical protein